ncbi:DUF3887 domain-containing protein [Candidatus Chloroploca sp. M-50]|uniref:DUF3887 domain-containing protein n=1 Tax=Candidatus Chloroploca mongolica TaxID=2528176 RepID=A0ABS4DAI9_9CHLR|nr:DUF3887 domain-containing protein [Candidatus Chloroploca mongolica]MBP1466445.1 DUF3887 domain-containing protein [Candidatus Chloroploca mongolica]
MKSKSIFIVLFAVLLSMLLFGCGSSTTELTGTDMDAVLAFSEDKTDALLSGMNNNDYAAFAQDFDVDMRKAMPQAQFDALKKDRDAKLGLYVSREVSSVVLSNEFYAVNYTAKFEKDDNVVVRVVFHVAEPHQVSGLWFNK